MQRRTKIVATLGPATDDPKVLDDVIAAGVGAFVPRTLDLPDIKRIVRELPTKRQTMLFSATIPPTVSALARQFQRDPVSIEIDMAHPPEAIEQALYPVPKHLKVQLLLAILERMDVDSMLVFTRTKQEADIVTRQLRQSRIAVACIHGDFKQRDRISALEGFRSGKHRVLVATNIAARGLDVEGISHVINYDVPEHPENYVHRIGRTGRAGRKGFDDQGSVVCQAPDDAIQRELAERRADDATREALDWLKCEFMQDKIGDEFDAVVTGVVDFGLFVQIPDLQIEGLIHVSSLGSEYFSRDTVHRRLTGERSGRSWQLADTVKVRVIRADLEQKKIDFELADAGPRGEDGGRRDRPRRRRARR